MHLILVTGTIMDMFKNCWAHMQYYAILRTLKIICFTFLFVIVTWRLILFLSFGDSYCKYLVLNKDRVTSYDSNFIQCINNLHEYKTYFRGVLTNKKQILFVGNAVVESIFHHFSKMIDKIGKKEASSVLHYIRSIRNRSETLNLPPKFWNFDGRNRTNFGNETDNCSLVLPSVLVYGEPQEKHVSLSISEIERADKLVSGLMLSAAWSNCHQRNVNDGGKLEVFEIISTAHSLGNGGLARNENNSGRIIKEYERIARNVLYLTADEVPGCCRFFENIDPRKRRGFSFFGLCFTLAVISKIGQTMLKKFVQNENARNSPGCASKIGISTSKLQDIAERILEDSKELSSAFTKFGLVMFYLYLVDCTRIMVHKDRDLDYGLLKSLLTLYFCLSSLSVARTKQAGVNSIHITREWRGWMQLYIIHMHRSDYGNQVPLGYSLACICVSAYLFLSGYGHFCYFWSKPGSSYRIVDILKCKPAAVITLLKDAWTMLSRYLQVAFRLNLLVCFVAVMTNQPPGRFYFISLTVLWFTIFTVTMSVYPRAANILSIRDGSLKNKVGDNAPHCTIQSEDLHDNRQNSGLEDTKSPHTLNTQSVGEATPSSTTGLPSHRQFILPVTLMLGKTLALILMIHSVCQSSAVFHKVWTMWPLKFIFFGRAEQYWYWRISNDAYSFIYGILFGLAAYSGKVFWRKLKFCGELHQSAPGCIQITEKSCCKRCSNQQCALSSSILNKVGCYVLESASTALGVVMLYLSIKHYVDGGYHAYMHKLNIRFCIVPIISYVLIRNSASFLRRHYSAFLARLGDISLELYVIHQVENDNVALIPNEDYKFFNELLWVATLVALSDEIHNSTKILGRYLVPKNFKTAAWLLPVCYFSYQYIYF